MINVCKNIYDDMKYQLNAGYRIRDKIDTESRAGQVNVLCLASFSPVSFSIVSCIF